MILTKQQAWAARDHYNKSGKINAIKYVREVTGCSLKEAKETVEDLVENRFGPQNPARRTIDDDWEISSERQYVVDAFDTAVEVIDELLKGLREAATTSEKPNVQAYEEMSDQAKSFIQQAVDKYNGEVE